MPACTNLLRCDRAGGTPDWVIDVAICSSSLACGECDGARLSLQISRQFSYDRSVAQHNQPVAHDDRLLNIRGNEEHSAALPRNVQQKPVNFDPCADIDAA